MDRACETAVSFPRNEGFPCGSIEKRTDTVGEPLLQPSSPPHRTAICGARVSRCRRKSLITEFANSVRSFDETALVRKQTLVAGGSYQGAGSLALLQGGRSPSKSWTGASATHSITTSAATWPGVGRSALPANAPSAGPPVPTSCEKSTPKNASTCSKAAIPTRTSGDSQPRVRR